MIYFTAPKKNAWFGFHDGSMQKLEPEGWWKALEQTLTIEDGKREQRIEAINKFKLGQGIDPAEYFSLFPDTEWPLHSC